MNMQGIKDRWEEMDPGHKQKILLGLTLSGVLVVGAAVMSVSESSTDHVVAERIENSLLPDGSARELGVVGIGREVDKMVVQMRAQEERIAELTRQLEMSAKAPGAASTDARMHAELVDLKAQIHELKTRPPAPGPVPAGTDPNLPQGGPQPTSPGGPRAGGAEGQMMPTVQEPAYGQIRTIEATPAPQATRTSATGAAEARKTYIPAGSMIQAVLLSGVDAPSGRGATTDPVPMLARVKHDLILPSRFRSSLRECFLLLEGYGELSSERVQARTSSMSCILNDKRVVEVALHGYAVGDDGKSGIRGTVMSKQGRALGMAFLAGIADGAAQALGGQNNNNLGLNQLGSGGVDLSRVGSGAMAGGASGALDRIAAFYLDRADSLFPVVTVEATRKVTIVLLKGAEITPLDGAG